MGYSKIFAGRRCLHSGVNSPSSTYHVHPSPQDIRPARAQRLQLGDLDPFLIFSKEIIDTYPIRGHHYRRISDFIIRNILIEQKVNIEPLFCPLNASYLKRGIKTLIVNNN